MLLTSADSGVWREVNSEGARVAESPEDITRFWHWFRGSMALDPLGRPLVVYRGEHGDPETTLDLSTRFGSLSFGDLETARFYAHFPNRRTDESVCPRVHIAYLAIRRPVLEQPDDPFVDLTTVEAQLGRQYAERIAKKFASWVMRTSPWTNGEIDALSVEEFLEVEPDGFARLYMEAYPLFDDIEEVAYMKATGFDGAIYGGAGFNACETEFRVFDKTSVWKITTNGFDGFEGSAGRVRGWIDRQRIESASSKAATSGSKSLSASTIR